LHCVCFRTLAVEGSAPPGQPGTYGAEVISTDDYMSFVDEAIDGLIQIVEGLGDDLANRRPAFPEANSPYAILTHCLGVMEFWGGHLVGGREVVRDREAEFVASGPVGELLARVAGVRRRFAEDVAGAEPFAPLRGEFPATWTKDRLGPSGRSQGGALLHVYEELAQHRGHMEGARDAMLAGAAPQGGGV